MAPTKENKDLVQLNALNKKRAKNDGYESKVDAALRALLEFRLKGQE